MTQTTDQGVTFAGAGGRRSSTAAAKAVLSDAVRAVDPDLARDVEQARNWRKDYVGLMVRLEAACAASAKAATLVAGDGLAAVPRNFVFARSGADQSLPAAFATYDESRFDTAEVPGRGERVARLAVPYRGELLAGGALHRQLDQWVAAGAIEPSCAAAILMVDADPNWLDASDLQVALIGAGSEMGPLSPLCQWGATVIAVDAPRPDIWARLLATAEKGSGRMLLPVRGAGGGDLVDRAGADLLTETPEIRTWLAGMAGPVVIGSYAYADGAGFPRVAVAADALIADLVNSRRAAAIAYLASPTDAFAVPADIVTSARASSQKSAGGSAARALSAGRLYRPHYESPVRPAGESGLAGIADSIVPQQGPNYALAKRIQRWRAIAARDEGVISSANVAPATRTRSVTRNRILSAAYSGAPRFGVEIFDPATSSVLMAALLLHDLRNPVAAAHPDAPLDHPAELLIDAAAHGGLWRIPYEPRSVLGLAVARGLLRRR